VIKYSYIEISNKAEKLQGIYQPGTDLPGGERPMKFVIIYNNTRKEGTYNYVRISIDKLKKGD